MNSTTLKLLRKKLEAYGYHCESDEETGLITVSLGVDKEERIWDLNLLPVERTLDAEKKDMADFLQFYLSFPYRSLPNSNEELARLILLVNKSFPFPAFGFSENENIIYYHHILYCEQGLVPITLTCSIIGNLCLYLDSLTPMIESVATGKRQLLEVLEETLSSGS